MYVFQRPHLHRGSAPRVDSSATSSAVAQRQALEKSRSRCRCSDRLQPSGILRARPPTEHPRDGRRLRHTRQAVPRAGRAPQSEPSADPREADPRRRTRPAAARPGRDPAQAGGPGPGARDARPPGRRARRPQRGDHGRRARARRLRPRPLARSGPLGRPAAGALPRLARRGGLDLERSRRGCATASCRSAAASRTPGAGARAPSRSSRRPTRIRRRSPATASRRAW